MRRVKRGIATPANEPRHPNTFGQMLRLIPAFIFSFITCRAVVPNSQNPVVHSAPTLVVRLNGLYSGTAPMGAARPTSLSFHRD